MAIIVGTMIASMMTVAISRMLFSAAPMGPLLSRMLGWQPPRRRPIPMAGEAARMRRRIVGEGSFAIMRMPLSQPTISLVLAGIQRRLAQFNQAYNNMG
ncbi:hypothetical protein ACYQR9_01580 [Methylobacterium sp. CM6241]|uniref:hypothetical protein n=1 Tax=unclassified Methylobacterium TaxID=2615210 RepID=UPI001FCD1917|nr:hypothetical protein [Methylobacterium sp. Leaf86]